MCITKGLALALALLDGCIYIFLDGGVSVEYPALMEMGMASAPYLKNRGVFQ